MKLDKPSASMLSVAFALFVGHAAGAAEEKQCEPISPLLIYMMLSGVVASGLLVLGGSGVVIFNTLNKLKSHCHDKSGEHQGIDPDAVSQRSLHHIKLD